jgi:hypothetical protein
MPIPNPLQQDRDNVGGDLLLLGPLVQSIPLQAAATMPSTSLANIHTYLQAVISRMKLCLGAGHITPVDRHYMATQFQGITNELNKP